MLLLADRLIEQAHIYRGPKHLREEFAYLADKIAGAQRFVISPDVRGAIRSLLTSRPSTLVEASRFARLPFERCWFEWVPPGDANLHPGQVNGQPLRRGAGGLRAAWFHHVHRLGIRAEGALRRHRGAGASDDPQGSIRHDRPPADAELRRLVGGRRLRSDGLRQPAGDGQRSQAQVVPPAPADPRGPRSAARRRQERRQMGDQGGKGVGGRSSCSRSARPSGCITRRTATRKSRASTRRPAISRQSSTTSKTRWGTCSPR